MCTEWGIPELVRTKWEIHDLVCPPYIRGSHRLLCQQTEQGNLLFPHIPGLCRGGWGESRRRRRGLSTVLRRRRQATMMLDLCLAKSLEWSRCFLHLIWVAVINSLCSLLAWKGHWHISLTLISLDGIGILIAPVAKWVRCSTIGKLAQALRNFACAERREGIYCSSFAHLCLHPLVLMIGRACF